MLSATQISIAYGKRIILRDVSLEVSAAKIIGVAGPNGVGKTTLLRFLSGTIPGAESNLLINEVSPAERERFAKRVFYLETAASLNTRLRGIDYLTLVHALWKSKRKPDEIIEELNISNFVKKPVESYSQGMAQLLVIAMALVSDAEVMLYDEPMNCLDPTNRILVRWIFEQQKSHGKIIILSTHQLDEIDGFADEVWFLNDSGIAHIRCKDDTEDSQAVYKRLYLKAGA